MRIWQRKRLSIVLVGFLAGLGISGYCQTGTATSTSPAKAAPPVQKGDLAESRASGGTNEAVAIPRRVQRAPVLVEQPPPPRKLEIVPLPPGPDYAWVPGQWMYSEGKWIWNEGAYKLRPYVGAVWMGGYWARHGRGWTWVRGHWR